MPLCRRRSALLARHPRQPEAGDVIAPKEMEDHLQRLKAQGVEAIG
ncbi:MAG TPA: hypothetical protein VGD66_09640 [Allosphingosinicella sp.]|jgi:hypothetical protein